MALISGKHVLHPQCYHHIGAAVSLAGLNVPYSTQVKSLKESKMSAMKRGTGGRSSFNGILATVFGASGFLGRYICNRLGKTGTQMIIPYRGEQYYVFPLKVCGDLGQVLFSPFHLKDEESLRKVMKYSNVVINMIGRDYETRNFKFADVHVEGARNIARIAKEMGVEKLIHMSSLNASLHPTPIMLKEGSQFLRTKYLGEQAVREEFPEAIIFRPSSMYGSEDRFLLHYVNNFRRVGRLIPLWKKGESTVKAPLFVGDMATGIVNAMMDKDAIGKTYEAVGPKRYQLSELVDWFYHIMRKHQVGYSRYDLRWDPLFQLRISLNEKFSYTNPYNTLVWDKIERDHITDVQTPGMPTLEDLGVQLTTMEDRVPWELMPWIAGSDYYEELGEFEPPANPKVVG